MTDWQDPHAHQDPLHRIRSATAKLSTGSAHRIRKELPKSSQDPLRKLQDPLSHCQILHSFRCGSWPDCTMEATWETPPHTHDIAKFFWMVAKVGFLLCFFFNAPKSYEGVSGSLWKRHKSKIQKILDRSYIPKKISDPKKIIFFRARKKSFEIFRKCDQNFVTPFQIP